MKEAVFSVGEEEGVVKNFPTKKEWWILCVVFFLFHGLNPRM